MPINDEPKLDRADWQRYNAKGGRCVICGHAAAVSVSLSSRELTGKVGGSHLASHSVTFCHEHGILRYGDALAKLK